MLITDRTLSENMHQLRKQLNVMQLNEGQSTGKCITDFVLSLLASSINLCFKLLLLLQF